MSKNVYLKAAQYCDEGSNNYLGACNCVEKFATGPSADFDGWREDTRKFITMFRPRMSDSFAYWAVKSKPKNDEELKNFRVLMLLFMHAMRKAGDV